ncbi:MAG: HD domain-containing phosphohydrolase [Candidatus Krumholzibacteria bacterium]
MRMSGNILVVDDDTNVLEILDRSLSKNGYKVQLAKTGEEALNLYRECEPDMLVIDVVLPDMDGREVLRILRSIPGKKPVPALFVSGTSDPDVMDSTFATGAEDFLVKPFSLRELNAKVKKVLGSYRNAAALERSNLALADEVSEGRENYSQINKQLQRQLLSMKTLFAVSQDLNRRLDSDELINGFALTLVGELQISSIAIFLLRKESDPTFTLNGIKGFDRDRIADLEIPADCELVRRLRDNPETQKIARTPDDSWVRRLPDVRLAIFEYITPIIFKQKVKGIVFSGPKLTGGEFNRFDLDMLRSISNSAAIGLENARLFRELQHTYLSTVKALVSIIEAKDAYTKGHTERVADYCLALGAKMKLSKDELRDVAFGAVLHDIGKLLVYERVLNKPGSLNSEEWEMLKQHPVIGASIIENMDFLSGTVALVKHHHEHYDGGGYPDGLVGDDIPVGARIIAVADTFDAMTTDRSYRKALSGRKALKTLQSKAGTQFDPNVVETFVKLIKDDGFKPRKQKPLGVKTP